MTTKTPIHNTYTLFASTDPADAPQRPKSDRVTLLAYRRTQRLSNPDFPTSSKGAADWRVYCADAAQEAMDQDGMPPVERWLVHAVYRWLLAHTRERVSVRGYLQSFVMWLLWSGKTSLTTQCHTVESNVIDYLHAMRGCYAERTVRTHYNTVRSWFRWLYDSELIDRMPVSRTSTCLVRVDEGRVCKADGTRQAFTASEAQRVINWLFSTATPVACLAVCLMGVEGLRSCEVPRLDMRHVTEVDGVTWLAIPGKGRKMRKIALEPVTVAAIDRYLSSNRRRGRRGALLLHDRCTRYSTATVQAWAREAARVVGRPEISSHDLRKTAITLLRESGADSESCRQKAGHSRAELTERCYVTRQITMQVTTGLQPPEGITK